MPNPPRPDLVQKAICAGLYSGNVDYSENGYKRFQDNPDMKNFTPAGVKLLLRQFICKGNGALETREEKFDQWLKEDPDNPYWYMTVIPVNEFPIGLFVKMKISDYDESDPWVAIVSVHEEKS